MSNGIGGKRLKNKQVTRVISLGGVQDRRGRRKKRKKRRSGGQGWKEWEMEMVPSWPGSKDTAWWSERSQETVGKKESDTEREKEKVDKKQEKRA